ncbi:MAG: hypothetical protein GXZ19_04815 [Bacteroidales bacterium]|nr:hypothetical protein [Bacteroidales bacterium]
MKQLVLLRHGKAEQGTMTKDDYDRLLTEYGKKNVSDMGDFILTKWGSPDLILSSSARRAYDTALLAAQRLGYPQEEIRTERDLYFAPSRWIVRRISQLGDEVNRCLYVGHNPSVTELINELGVRLDNLPTASAACFEFHVDSWAEISTGRATFLWLKLPKER